MIYIDLAEEYEMNAYEILKMVSELTFSDDYVLEIKKDFKEAEKMLEVKAKNRVVDQGLLSKSYSL